jgi:hypothetical protein
MQKLNDWRSGAGKWKNIYPELFRIQILKPHLVKLPVNHTRNTTFTSKYAARVMDLHHGFNINDVDYLCLVEPAYLGEKWLIWSSSVIKCVYRQVERYEINYTIIRDQDSKGEIVDGINTRRLLKYLIHEFGLSDVTCRNRLQNM